MSDVIVVSGPPGVGKTTVAWEMTDVLEERDIAFGFFDPDGIHFRPAEEGDPFNSRVWLAALHAVWPLMAVERLIVPVVVEERGEAERLLPGANVTVARLTAATETLDERIRKREIGSGPGVDWHSTRAKELQEHWQQHPAQDFVVETDRRGVRELALEVLTQSGWI